MARKKRIQADKSDLHVSDFGNIEIPDLDLSLFDVLNDGYDEETRYTKPKVYELEKRLRPIRQRGKVGAGTAFRLWRTRRRVC